MIKVIPYLTLFLFFYTSIFAENVTLRWESNDETDLAGYKLYYRTDGLTYGDETPPEDIIDQGPSPIVISVIDPNAPNYIENIDPEFMLTGLDLSDKDYYFVLTAFDDELPNANESGFSNEVNTLHTGTGGAVTISGSDSGGGGCFISAAKE